MLSKLVQISSSKRSPRELTLPQVHCNSLSLKDYTWIWSQSPKSLRQVVNSACVWVFAFSHLFGVISTCCWHSFLLWYASPQMGFWLSACVCPNRFSCVWLFVTLWVVAHQAPLSMGFSRQEYWSRLPCPPPGDLPDPGIEPASLTSPAFPAAAAAESLQSCPTLCDPRDGSPPGSPIPGILQARTLEWVAISFSSAWKWKVKVKLLSHVWLFATPWTAAHQAPSPMGFFRQGYWSGAQLRIF